MGHFPWLWQLVRGYLSLNPRSPVDIRLIYVTVSLPLISSCILILFPLYILNKYMCKYGQRSLFVKWPQVNKSWRVYYRFQVSGHHARIPCPFHSKTMILRNFSLWKLLRLSCKKLEAAVQGEKAWGCCAKRNAQTKEIEERAESRAHTHTVRASRQDLALSFHQHGALSLGTTCTSPGTTCSKEDFATCLSPTQMVNAIECIPQKGSNNLHSKTKDDWWPKTQHEHILSSFLKSVLSFSVPLLHFKTVEMLQTQY